MTFKNRFKQIIKLQIGSFLVLGLPSVGIPVYKEYLLYFILSFGLIMLLLNWHHYKKVQSSEISKHSIMWILVFVTLQVYFLILYVRSFIWLFGEQTNYILLMVSLMFFLVCNYFLLNSRIKKGNEFFVSVILDNSKNNILNLSQKIFSQTKMKAYREQKYFARLNDHKIELWFYIIISALQLPLAVIVTSYSRHFFHSELHPLIFGTCSSLLICLFPYLFGEQFGIYQSLIAYEREKGIKLRYE